MPAGSINVRLFGALHALRRQSNLPTVLSVEVPDEGMTGTELAAELELPLAMIEGIFCNHTVYAVTHRLYPGDEVAFVPQGTPGPHRFMLGLYRAGQEGQGEGEKL